jgi:putative redox protein
VGEPNVWSIARLPDAEHRNAAVTVNGFDLACEIPADDADEPAGATPFGLLAGSLSACTAMTIRDYLRRWRVEPGEVVVHVAVLPGSPPVLDRRVSVAGAVTPELRQQLAVEIDNTPVTRLLLAALTIRTVLTTGPTASPAASPTGP